MESERYQILQKSYCEVGRSNLYNNWSVKNNFSINNFSTNNFSGVERTKALEERFFYLSLLVVLPSINTLLF